MSWGIFDFRHVYKALFVIVFLGVQTSCKKPTVTSISYEIPSEQVLAALPPAISITPLAEARRIATDFIHAEKFTLFPTTEEEIWFGQEVVVASDLTAGVGYIFLKLKPPNASVSFDQKDIPNKINMGTVGFLSSLTTHSGTEDAEAGLLMQEAQNGKPSPRLGVVQFLKNARAPNGYFHLVPTEGRSIVLQEKYPYWIRGSGSRMLIITVPVSELADGGKKISGRGVYAELWRIQ